MSRRVNTRHLLEADPEVEADPDRFYDRIVDIDLSSLEPHVVGPHTPDLARPISHLADEVKAKGYVDDISVALIGSCTNSSYEDMSRAADVANQAQAHGAEAAVRLLVTPGSEQVRATIERDGQMKALQDIRATVLANACGPCIGQWRRSEVKQREPNTILTSYNRNFPRRNDGHAETMNFIASPEIVVALSLAGSLSFNPSGGQSHRGRRRPPTRWNPPRLRRKCPPTASTRAPRPTWLRPRTAATLKLSSTRTASGSRCWSPFDPWDGEDFLNAPILLKAKGKCTTDHISPAGPWLRFRGHLDNLSDNMFLGAANAYTGETGHGLNPVTGETGQEFPQIARRFKAEGSALGRRRRQ